MNIEKRGKNSYRIRKMVKGKTYILTFDHKPSDVEIAAALVEQTKTIDTNFVSQSFEVCCEEYIAMKANVLSPSTIRSYRTIIRTISEHFKQKNIDRITQIDIQMEINNLTVGHSPKTVHNIHGFISSILGTFRPQMIINTTLPQKVKFEPYTPSETDIKKILDYVKDSKYEIPFQLGVLGMRRSEICCITKDDIDGNYLKINKAKVMNDKHQFVIKNLTKTENGKRNIYIPDSMIAKINDYGFAYDGNPEMLNQYLHLCQDKLKLHRFRFHDLRAFYASYAHSCGIPDSVIMMNGGWKSDFTMKNIYRRAIQNDVDYYQKALVKDLLS